jgi:hypothetical protein
MNSLAAALQRLADAVVGLTGDAFGDRILDGMADEGLLRVLAEAGRLARAAEAVMIETIVQIDERSHRTDHAQRLTTRHGCRNVNELVQRSTRMSSRAAAALITAGVAVRRPMAPSSGELLPADFPGLRAALAAGEIGVDGLMAVFGPLRGSPGGRAALLAADAELSAAARGEGADAAPPACADDLRALATVWAVYLDQDGAAPREARAMRKRHLTLGVCRDGIVPVRGGLLPEVAGQLRLLCDSILNPKVGGAPAPTGPVFEEDPDDPSEPLPRTADDRTHGQKQHDALAIILTVAAASGGMPQLGGSAPTLVVTVRAEDLEHAAGSAHIGGIDEPVPLSVARHVACAGAIQRVVFDGQDQIIALHSLQRVFTPHQRRAIAARDGGCIIPGCRVPAHWCEVHHVQEHARGGPTHTGNGVTLCWHHHRTLDTSGWHIRMNHGIPEVRGPYWWDSRMLWRPITKSPTRLHDRITRRKRR